MTGCRLNSVPISLLGYNQGSTTFSNRDLRRLWNEIETDWHMCAVRTGRELERPPEMV